MKKKQIVGLVIAVVLFIITGVASVLTNAFSRHLFEESVGDIITGSYEFNPPVNDYIAIVRVEGTIQEQADTNAFGEAVGYQHATTLD